jgi:DNA-binding HxlR family transcriptional regulator
MSGNLKSPPSPHAQVPRPSDPEHRPPPGRNGNAEIAATTVFLRGIFPFETFPLDAPTTKEGGRRALELLGLRWNLLILRAAASGATRYAEIERELGIPRKMLARRLKLLVAHGLLERRPYEARPPRFEYRLTGKGWDLSHAVALIAEWGERHMAGDEGGAVRITTEASKTNGQELSVAS